MLPHKLPSAASSLVTVSTTALNLRDAVRAADSPTSDTFEIPEGANRCEIQAVTEDVRYFDDGNTPTTALGKILQAGEGLVIDGDLTKFQMIRDGGVNATLTVSFFTVYRGEH